MVACVDGIYELYLQGGDALLHVRFVPGESLICHQRLSPPYNYRARGGAWLGNLVAYYGIMQEATLSAGYALFRC